MGKCYQQVNAAQKAIENYRKGERGRSQGVKAQSKVEPREGQLVIARCR